MPPDLDRQDSTASNISHQDSIIRQTSIQSTTSEKMDVDLVRQDSTQQAQAPKEKKISLDKEVEKDKDKKEEKKPEEKKPEEPPFETLHNPARVTAAQQKFITWESEQRYIPIKKQLAGIVMLRDTRPEDPEKIVITKAPTVGIPGISEDEPEPPEPFTFTRYL